MKSKRRSNKRSKKRRRHCFVRFSNPSKQWKECKRRMTVNPQRRSVLTSSRVFATRGRNANSLTNFLRKRRKSTFIPTSEISMEKKRKNWILRNWKNSLNRRKVNIRSNLRRNSCASISWLHLKRKPTDGSGCVRMVLIAITVIVSLLGMFSRKTSRKKTRNKSCESKTLSMNSVRTSWERQARLSRLNDSLNGRRNELKRNSLMKKSARKTYKRNPREANAWSDLLVERFSCSILRFSRMMPMQLMSRPCKTEKKSSKLMTMMTKKERRQNNAYSSCRSRITRLKNRKRTKK